MTWEIAMNTQTPWVRLPAVLALVGLTSLAQAAPVGSALQRPAVQSPAAAKAVLQCAALAGQRLVAVGERGIVVLSDDRGKTWRQSESPVSVGLTAVRFADAQHGWIVGHGGVVLASADGGLSWRKQFDGLQAAQSVLKEAQAAGDAKVLADAERLVADGADKPFLDLHFFDAQHGLIVGAYNLAFETRDGGKTWQSISRRLDNPRSLHLYSIRARGSEVLIVGEQGLVLRSTDGAQSFQRIVTPYKGSYFSAELPGPTDMVLAGLRGNVWKSADAGASWTQVPSPMPVSFTASVLDANARLWLANQAGLVWLLADGALRATRVKLPPINGLLPLGNGQLLALTGAGAVPVSLIEGVPR